jgi:putative Mg2+ transporter-C (MgtC) family protein
MDHLHLVARIASATLLGGAIGFQHEVHGRPAGLRTHMLVALASALFMVVSTQFVFYQHYPSSEVARGDPARIAAQVVSGSGFIAGGVILHSGISIQGLTTAAGLWLVVAIGLCAGGGMYWEAVSATVLGVTTLEVLRRFEKKPPV